MSWALLRSPASQHRTGQQSGPLSGKATENVIPLSL